MKQETFADTVRAIPAGNKKVVNCAAKIENSDRTSKAALCRDNIFKVKNFPLTK